MLEDNYSEKLDLLLNRLQVSVQIPEEWADYLGRKGVLPTTPNDDRRFSRRYLRAEAICETSQSLPAIERRHEFNKVYLKDISRNGIGFITARELYPEEQVVMWTRVGKFNCSVARCRKHNDRCFEIGATIVVDSARLPAGDGNEGSLGTVGEPSLEGTR
jgi:hypothetical protein